MEKCIYSLKMSSQATFNGQEHIIPACIGGILKLPKGYVSDETNTMFSSLEKSFSRDSIISISRTFLGPGKERKYKQPINPESQKLLFLIKTGIKKARLE